jgi:pimeloyl-ACP methyl ester carboxylesterase
MRVGIILAVVVAVLLAPLGLLWAFQRRLIYLPAPRSVPPAATVLPGAEEVSFETADGLRLEGWFVPGAVEGPVPGAVDGPARPVSRSATLPDGAPPAREPGVARPGAARPGDARQEPVRPGQVRPGSVRPGSVRLGQVRPGSVRPGPAVLVCNGNGGNRSLRAPLAEMLAGMGLHVLLFDYRGYAANPGNPTEAGLAADARAAQAYLAGRPEVDPDRLVYFGESLGAAVALRLATERPPAALVLRSPFASLAEVGRHHYPVLPVSLLLRDRYEASALAGRLTAPLLVVAGERDRIVPVGHSRRLFAAAPEPKRLVVLDGVDHNDHELNAGPRLGDELRAFLGTVPGLTG